MAIVIREIIFFLGADRGLIFGRQRAHFLAIALVTQWQGNEPLGGLIFMRCFVNTGKIRWIFPRHTSERYFLVMLWLKQDVYAHLPWNIIL